MVESTESTAPEAVYCNGRILAASEAHLSLADWGALYGLGFFETFRTSGGRPHHWSFHRARLEQACATAGIAVPPAFLAADETRLRAAVHVLLEKNKMTEGVLRYTLTAGRASPNPAAEFFAEPAEFLAVHALPPPAPDEGVSLRVLALPRDNGEWLPRPKSLNYANVIAGVQELQRRDAEPSDEGLFLTRGDGFVVETVRRNIAWIEDGWLCYPDPDLGAVAGTCLRWMLQLGFAAKARRAKLPELLQADAIVVLNSVRGITPVCTVWDTLDKKHLRSLDSAAHPIVVRLQDAWKAALRETASAVS